MSKSTSDPVFVPIAEEKSGITSLSPNGVQIIPKDEFDKLTSKVQDHKRQLDLTFAMLIGIVLVLFITFISFLLDSYKFKTETYQRLIDKMDANDSKAIEEKFTDLQNKLDILQRDLKNTNTTNDKPAIRK